MFWRVSFLEEFAGRIMGENTMTGGFALTPVKKLNGARFRTPPVVDCGNEGDRTGHDGSHHELVGVLRSGGRWIHDHLLSSMPKPGDS